MATILDVADAVVSELNAGSFGLPFTAERRYAPRFEMQDMDTLRITVVPKGLEIAAASRGEHQHDYQVDVAVQQKFSEGDAAELDPLMGLVEEIADFFRGRRLESVPAVCVRVENGPVYAQEHIKEMRQFTSILTFTWRVWR